MTGIAAVAARTSQKKTAKTTNGFTARSADHKTFKDGFRAKIERRKTV
jgi:hypothetical protein